MDFRMAEARTGAERGSKEVNVQGFRPGLPMLRRAVFFLLVAATVFLAGFALTEILAANGFEVIEVFILVLFLLNFILIALSFWTAIIGFFIRILGRDPINLRPVAELRTATSPAVTTKTAIAVPVYNEDPQRVFAGIEAMYASLGEIGALDHFALFVLSDTTCDDIAAEEKRCWTDLCKRQNAQNRLFYRRRHENIGRKAGNIADFCEHWGYAYEHMVVLDADSIMSGSDPGSVGAFDAGQSAGGANSNGTNADQPANFVRPGLAIRQPAGGAYVIERPKLLAFGREQLLGTQRDHQNQSVCDPLRASDATGQALLWEGKY